MYMDIICVVDWPKIIVKVFVGESFQLVILLVVLIECEYTKTDFDVMPMIITQCYS